MTSFFLTTGNGCRLDSPTCACGVIITISVILDPPPFVGHSHWVESIAFSTDGLTLISGSSDCTIQLWETKSRERLGGALSAHTNNVWSVALSPNGRIMASSSKDATIVLWDFMHQPPRQLVRLNEHSDSVGHVVFSPDGKWLASASRDCSARLWNITNILSLLES